MSFTPPPVPDSLSELDQWVLWRYESLNGRTTKVPYAVDGRRASSTDARSWASFEDVIDVSAGKPTIYSGIGFVFRTHGNLVGIDLDDCLLEDGSIKAWAHGVIDRFADTYMEVSPSGVGVKIWARGQIPSNVPGIGVGDGQIEMYDHARYFTVTGMAFNGAPLEVENHSGDLLDLYNHLKPEKRLWPLQPLACGRIPYGQQHSTLISIAGTLRARRVCDAAIEACLQAINEHQCERPGSRENISRIVKSSRAWRQREHR